ncbi:Inositol 2-dehydrogenase/D-chiro-inositol 3-dehydrogenase [subsurface metagenome]
MKRIGVIGLGYWGSKLARCFDELDVLWAIADRDERRVYEVNESLGVGNLAADIGALLALGCDAIAIATPSETHYDIAREALNAGRDIFIEKPMTISSSDAESLQKQAGAQGRNLMVGHIYLHNGGIKRMPIPVGKAELYVQLLNEGGGPSPSTMDVLWAGLPHACSLALHFFPDMPDWIEAEREEERIKVALRYWNDSMAYLDVGDNTGRKLRKVELDWGSSRYLFDATDPIT